MKTIHATNSINIQFGLDGRIIFKPIGLDDMDSKNTKRRK